MKSIYSIQVQRQIRNLLSLLLIALMGTATAYAEEGDRNKAGEVDQTIVVQGLDNMKFDVEEITARPGETIRIEFETVSSMPPEAMKHNIAILDSGVDADAFVMASLSAVDNEYIAPSFEDQVIAHTAMIGGGETSVIEFTVPDEPGEYVYVCSFPGHFQAGMKGVLIVQ